MIPSLLIAFTCGLAPAATPATQTASVALDPGLHRFRIPYELLLDKTVGTASKPVRFDWRKSTVQLGGFIAQPSEYNNYESIRGGGVVRIPTQTLLYEIGLSYVWVWETESSRQLALTPYRQPGRPRHFELDFTLGLPLAEGVVTAWPGWFPAAELVFSAYFNLRYLVYPTGFGGLKVREIFAASLSPRITDKEIENLDDERLPGMALDRTRYGLFAGFGTDIYFDFGLFVAPRVLIAVPLFAAAAESQLRLTLELSVSVGAAF